MKRRQKRNSFAEVGTAVGEKMKKVIRAKTPEKVLKLRWAALAAIAAIQHDFHRPQMVKLLLLREH